MLFWARTKLVLLVVLVSFSLAVSPSFSVRAQTTGSPTLFIAPSHQDLASPGSIVTYSVNVSNISPSNGIAGWVIFVKTNNTVLTPLSITLGSFLSAPVQVVNCINGVSTFGSCTGDDGSGIAHSEVYSQTGATSSGNGTLFTIAYKAVAGPFTLLTFYSAIGNKSQLLDVVGNPISTTTIDGDYGNTPTALPIASFTYSPFHPFAGDLVTFNASSSFDPNGHSLVQYSWLFNQGSLPPTEAKGVITSKVLARGNWIVILVVTNDQGVPSRPTSRMVNVTLIDLEVRIAVSQNYVLPGTPIRITGEVLNLGTTTVPANNITVDVAGKVLLAVSGYLLPPSPGGYAFPFDLTWNTTGLTPGFYTVHAHVDPLVNETKTANNDCFLTEVLIYPMYVTAGTYSYVAVRNHGSFRDTISVTNLGSLNMTVSLYVVSSPPGLKTVFQSSNFTITAGGSATTVLRINLAGASRGIYFIGVGFARISPSVPTHSAFTIQVVIP